MNDDELTQFGEELASAVPPLPPEALARVEAQMRAAITSLQRRRRWRRVVVGLSVAAAVLIAVTIFMWPRGGGAPDSQQWADDLRHQRGKIERAVIADDVVIAIGEGSPRSAPEQSLVQLDKYSSLFTD